ncbi:monovalent cation/H(+) antiporter subunit G [Acuticoccus kandeliae]|uniref:monovalent cation/H(+) antiporter subunit G n=1 Tax=Acuticoccus kandeliae TaxID=2073160 RepID=UPI00196A81DE|nr:monovalent cation/H(+) antiporter subunit G [Acuticoccus kandeliae]
MTALIALALKIGGVAFLLIAAVGVMRLSDPFQRMHAATKAGTLGAGLVVLGTLVGQQATDVAVMGGLTIVFLLLTVPVAGHLLGRAAYISGTPLGELTGGNALDGVLDRAAKPLGERFVADGPAAALPGLGGTSALVPAPAAHTRLERLESVHFTVICGEERHVFRRAHAIGAANDSPLTAHAILDSRTIEAADDPAGTRAEMRKACGRAMAALQAEVDAAGVDLTVRYDEGAPETLLRHQGAGRALLVAPQDGWFHHGVDPVHSGMSWAPDALLHLPAIHDGPVLYAGPARAAGAGRIAILDRGEAHLPGLLDWALATRLWPVREVALVGRHGEARRRAIADLAADHGATVSPMAAVPPDAEAVLLATMPRPLRARWYGMAWTERLAPGFSGDILAMEKG